MKKNAIILFGLMNSIIVILLTTILVAIIGDYFFVLNIFYFIPVGTILLGIVANIGVKIGMLYGDIPYSKKMRIFPIILSIICFMGIYFFTYKITYVSPNMEINYKFYGEHISNFVVKDTLENITFSKFLSHEMANRSYDPYFAFGNSGVVVPINSYGNGPIDPNSANWFLFFVEGLGFIAGGLYVLEGLKEERYCKDCKKYYITKKIFSTNMQAFEQRLEEFNNSIHNGESLKKFISSLDKLPIIKRKSHVIATMVFCPKCSKGILYIKYKRRTRLGFENAHLKMKKYELNSNIINSALNN